MRLDAVVGRIRRIRQNLRGICQERVAIAALQFEFAEYLGHHDLAGHIAGRVTAHTIGQHGISKPGPKREIRGQRVFLMVPASDTKDRSYVKPDVRRSLHDPFRPHGWPSS